MKYLLLVVYLFSCHLQWQAIATKVLHMMITKIILTLKWKKILKQKDVDAEETEATKDSDSEA